MRILLTGGTGWIGQRLGLELAIRGHDLVVPSRAKTPSVAFPCEVVRWDASKEAFPAELLKGIDAVVHLMGESVASGRWTAERKAKIRSSRIESLQKLKEGFKAINKWPKVVVSASAIGIFGDRGDEELIETSSPGAGFLADVTKDWEKALNEFPSSVRKVSGRIGIVLGEAGGALEKMVPPFMMNLGGPMAGGEQWMSWVHITDVVKFFVRAVETDAMEGAYNVVSPSATKQYKFAQTLAKVLGKSAMIPTPRLALSVLFGEMSEVLLSSVRAYPQRLVDSKFDFAYTDLEAALRDCLKAESQGLKLYTTQVYIEAPVERVWPFFSSETNLEALTPSWLNFKVLGKDTEKIQAGTRINYRLRLAGLPFRWRTHILEWKEMKQFVDLQEKGPYQTWHHTHTFVPLGRGTVMTDRVLYQVPLGWLGRVVAGWQVDQTVRKIFDFRTKVIGEVFGANSPGEGKSHRSWHGDHIGANS